MQSQDKLIASIVQTPNTGVMSGRKLSQQFVKSVNNSQHKAI